MISADYVESMNPPLCRKMRMLTKQLERHSVIYPEQRITNNKTIRYMVAEDFATFITSQHDMTEDEHTFLGGIPCEAEVCLDEYQGEKDDGSTVTQRTLLYAATGYYVKDGKRLCDNCFYTIYGPEFLKIVKERVAEVEEYAIDVGAIKKAPKKADSIETATAVSSPG